MLKKSLLFSFVVFSIFYSQSIYCMERQARQSKRDVTCRDIFYCCVKRFFHGIQEGRQEKRDERERDEKSKMKKKKRD